MDPITLFMMANSAVAAVKKGCQLYKDIKSAAGDVKAVIKDLDEQFNSAHKDKPATVEQRNQYVQEKNRIIELNRRAGETTNIYTELGEQLGVYYENYYKCLAIFEEEERRAKTEVYTGDVSLGKRALQRVLMRKQLEQMGTELREVMVYQSPPELGALHTEVEQMMEVMGKEQKVLMAKKLKEDYAASVRRRKRLEAAKIEIAWGIGVVIIACAIGLIFAMVVESRIKMYPRLGEGWIPTTPHERYIDSLPKRYTGR